MFCTREAYSDVKEEIADLLPAHRDEVGMFGDEFPANPAWDMYDLLDEAGYLHILTGREKGELVAYYSTVITRHLHYAFKSSDNDILYIKPEYRTMKALRFFRFVEDYHRAISVDFMIFSIKDKVDFRPFAEKMGFNLLEYKYFKRLR